MTEPTTQRAAKPAGRGAAGVSLAWKSSVLAAGLGAVVLGAGMLTKASQPPAQPQVIIVQVPADSVPLQIGQNLASGQSQPAAIQGVQLPAMPQKPIFQQPIARTRAS